MELCITLFFDAAISVILKLFNIIFFARKITKYELFKWVVTYKDQKSIIAHKCYVLLKYLQFKSNFWGKMYAKSYRKTKNEGFSMLITWKIGQTKWAETILIMRWETSDWNMNDFKFRFLLQHLLNINQNFKVCLKKLRL